MNRVSFSMVNLSILYLGFMFLMTIFGGLFIEVGIYAFLVSFYVSGINANNPETPILVLVKKLWLEILTLFLVFSPEWTCVGVCLLCVKEIVNKYVIKNNSAFESMAILGACLIAFASISIRQFETLEACNIKNGFDAIWWSICTITTVGYGDKFPITDEGKVIALMLMISGIGLFGTLIGYVSTFFIDREKANNDTIDTIEELSEQIAEIKELLKNK